MAQGMAQRGQPGARAAVRNWWLVVAMGALLGVGACAGPERLVVDEEGPVPEDYRVLVGWSRDNHADAIPALLHTCRYLRSVGNAQSVGHSANIGQGGDWRQPCAAAAQLARGDRVAARRFFETWFTPMPLSRDGEEGLFTGYYESELNGSWTRTERFSVPLYRVPAGLRPTRGQVAAGALAGRGLELMWVDDAVEAFITEIQGSGRVRMTDGSVVGLNYAGQNGHKYFAIGKALIDMGVTTADKMTMHVIRDWLHAHPADAQRVMNLNPSYVYFKLRESGEPRGASSELTPRRSLAVDPTHVPLGVPLWLDLREVPVVPGGVLRTLVLAQDTGGAIKGAVRGDYFWGHGNEAAYAAGMMKARGRYFMLVPRPVAQRLLTASRP